MTIGRRDFVTGTLAAAGAALLPAGPAGAAAFGSDIVEKAKAEGPVSLYTSLDTQIVDAILARFQQRFGVKVEYYRGTPSDVAARSFQEASAGGIRADVIDMSDVAAFLEMKRRNLLRAYNTPFAKFIVPAAKDPDGTWYGCRLTHAIIEWNTKSTPSGPKSYAECADPQWKGKLAMYSDAGGSEVARLWTIADAVGINVVKKIAANQVLLADTVQNVTQLVEQGERTVAINQNDNIAARSKLQGRPTDFLFPSDVVPTEVGAVAIVKSAKHPNGAQLLHDWWLSDEGQKVLVGGGKVSSRSDIYPPRGYPHFTQVKTRIIQSSRFQKQRAELIKEFQSMFGRS